MRVLISAYACEPGKGSEPAVGWNWVQQISRWHEVWVLTRKNNRPHIAGALAATPLTTVHWVYYDLPGWAHVWKKGQRGVHAYYYLWQLGAYFLARKLHRQVHFDLVHHVTFVNYWMPSLLALLPAPFIWGPVGGGESAPRAFRHALSLRGKIHEVVRDLARNLGQLNPCLKMTARRSRVGIATTEETAQRMRKLGCQNVQVFSQVGLQTADIARLAQFPVRQGLPFRFVSVGNLLHWKGFEFALRAFARFQSYYPASQYWIVGAGPERKRLERLAGQLGVSHNVEFCGAVSREQVWEKLAESDALLHPSLHDSGGWVCLEAMAAGHPVICFDLGGPALQVTPETGFKLAAISPEQVVEDLTVAMLHLAQNSRIRERMGEAARSRVEEQFNWTRKGEVMHRLYQEVAASLGGSAC